MEDRLRKLIKNHRRFLIFYLIWLIFHIGFLISGSHNFSANRFWPFGDGRLKYYDISELIYYLIIPFLVLFIWKLFMMNKKKEEIEDDEEEA